MRKFYWILMLVLLVLLIASSSVVQILRYDGFLRRSFSSSPTSWEKSMVQAGLDYLRSYWWYFIASGVTVMILVFCSNLLGDDLRDALDPRLFI